VCAHRACVCTALINEIPTGQGREVSSGCCRGVPAGDMGARSALACSAHGLGRCNPEPSIWRRSQFATRPLRWSDLNRLLEQAGTPALCRIPIRELAVRGTGQLDQSPQMADALTVRRPLRAL
jgi:hypothetical protein